MPGSPYEIDFRRSYLFPVPPATVWSSIEDVEHFPAWWGWLGHFRMVGDELKQPVPPVPPGAAANQTPVTWHIRADREGTFVIEVQSSNGVSQKKTISVKTKTIF